MPESKLDVYFSRALLMLQKLSEEGSVSVQDLASGVIKPERFRKQLLLELEDYVRELKAVVYDV